VARELLQPALEPLLLRLAEVGAPGRLGLRAWLEELVAAGLVVAVLALVEQEQVGVGASGMRP
jgi:hypothetical protein